MLQRYKLVKSTIDVIFFPEPQYSRPKFVYSTTSFNLVFRSEAEKPMCMLLYDQIWNLRGVSLNIVVTVALWKMWGQHTLKKDTEYSQLSQRKPLEVLIQTATKCLGEQIPANVSLRLSTGSSVARTSLRHTGTSSRNMANTAEEDMGQTRNI